jgi:endonuclease YncB( thermonuclease family)
MNKALWAGNGGLKMGSARFGKHGLKTGSVKQVVHDGDTTLVRLDKNLSVRFLGIDSPEISFEFPGTGKFVPLADPKWDQFFTSGEWENGLDIPAALLADLKGRIGNGVGVAQNHAEMAIAAQRSLEAIVEADLLASGKTKEDFEQFMAFAHEFLDSYGRLLCYLNSALSNFAEDSVANAIKRWSYNERQLMSGWAVPYFIWPNVQPFLGKAPFREEHVNPQGFWNLIKGASKMRIAREAVASARQEQKGIFNLEAPLRVMPFELRFLCRKKGPERYVINLADIGTNQLLPPSQYFSIHNPEDRLYVPPEYLPIFKAFGWQE